VKCTINTFNNAAKVLPGIAKQLGDIRIENRTDVYPVPRVAPNNTMNDLIASEWVQETKSWFRQKGLGANHEHAKIEREHPAPFSFQDVGRLIRFFTKEGESVIDPFCGVGSTNKAAALDGRKSTGIELSKKWVDLCHKRMEVEVGEKADNVDVEFICGDSAIEIGKLVDDGRSFQFLVTSPPYWSILNKKADHKVKQERLAKDLATNYSEDEEDLGNIEDYEQFLNKLTEIFLGCWGLLDHGRYAAVIVSDFRHGSKYYPFHAHLIDRLTDENVPNHFELQGLKVLLQTHKRLFPYGYPTTYVENIHHQYIIILRKPKKRK
jgi:DNA modification methylase